MQWPNPAFRNPCAVQWWQLSVLHRMGMQVVQNSTSQAVTKSLCNVPSAQLVTANCATITCVINKSVAHSGQHSANHTGRPARDQYTNFSSNLLSKHAAKCIVAVERGGQAIAEGADGAAQVLVDRRGVQLPAGCIGRGRGRVRGRRTLTVGTYMCQGAANANRDAKCASRRAAVL